METELLKMLPGGGSAVALIITVILFLKQQEKTNQTLREITDKFNAQVSSAQTTFQEQVSQIMNHLYEYQKLNNTQIKALIDDNMAITKETIVAVKALEGAVHEVKGRLEMVAGKSPPGRRQP